MKVLNYSFVREKAGVISALPIYILYDTRYGYMYEGFTLWQLLKVVLKEWKNDKHLIG